jgi:hypothetical protein
VRYASDEIDAVLMLSTLAVSGYALPFPNLPPAGSRRRATTDDGPHGLLRLEETARAVADGLKEQKVRFKTLYQEAKKLDLNADEIEALASALLSKEQELAARWLPKLRALDGEIEAAKSGSPQSVPEADRRWCRYAEQLVEAAITWLEEYQNARIRLIKLASDRRSLTEPSSPVFDDAETATEYLRKLVAE